MKSFTTLIDGQKQLPFKKENFVPTGKYNLPFEEYWIAQGEFGVIGFRQYRGTGYEIWFNHYKVKKNFTLELQIFRPLLIFHAKLFGNFQLECNGHKLAESPGQYGMVCLETASALANFSCGTDGETFNIIFSEDFLSYYAACCPALKTFLENVCRQKEISLMCEARLLTPAMHETIHAMLNCGYTEPFSLRFMDGRMHELLMNMVYNFNLQDAANVPGPAEIELAEKVKNIILSDLSRYETVEALARKVHVTEAKLQGIFKQVYETTVGKFSREARLKKAYELLSDTGEYRETLLSIALAVGYNDTGNFSNAFKQFFGYPPGHIYKTSKRG